MDFDYLTRLSRLSFKAEEKQKMQEEMKAMIALMDEIQTAVITETPSGKPGVGYKDLREDCVRYGGGECIKKEGGFTVPKVVG